MYQAYAFIIGTIIGLFGGDLEMAKELTSSQDETYRILATGDIGLGRSVNAKIQKLQDPTFPFLKTAEFLSSADAVFVNLESPLVPDCPITLEGMIFCGAMENVKGLSFAGIDVVTVANNHSGNHGKRGFETTLEALRGEGLQVVGQGEPAVLTIKGTRVGFLGYTDVGDEGAGMVFADPAVIAKDVVALRPKADVIIVGFHWGEEYRSEPTARQTELAHSTVDAGADLIVGHHPHWVQGVEKYKDTVIAYSHGNFVFDQMWSRETREGVIGEYVFRGKDLVDVRFHPVIIENYAQPRFATEEESKPVIERMRQASRGFTDF